MNRTIWVIIIIIILILIGWWLFAMNPAPATNSTSVNGPSTSLGINEQGAGQTNTGAQSVAAVIATSSTAALGQFLVAANGMTLYAYANDKAGVSNCSGACAAAWPPYTVSTNEPLVVPNGIKGQVGTITRSDGTAQLTYNDMPLYFYQKDTKPGDVSGQNVGGVWKVVKP